jgi:hypothetical protein
VPLLHIAEILKLPKMDELVHLSSDRCPVAYGPAKMLQQEREGYLLMEVDRLIKAD